MDASAEIHTETMNYDPATDGLSGQDKLYHVNTERQLKMVNNTFLSIYPEWNDGNLPSFDINLTKIWQRMDYGIKKHRPKEYRPRTVETIDDQGEVHVEIEWDENPITE